MAEEEGVVGVLDKYNLDALVMPTFTSFHLPAIAGLPIITVPLGFYPSKTPVTMNLKGTTVNVGPGVPFGISFVSRRWSEETLISLAYAFEQRTMAREKMRPYVRPTFELGDRASHSADAFLGRGQEKYHFPAQLETLQASIKRIISGLISPRKWTWTLLGFAASLM